jgi:hypothetical protein
MVHTGFKVYYYPQSRKIAQELLALCLPHIFHQNLLILQVRGFELIIRLPQMINP